jgi:hypothetical protein
MPTRVHGRLGELGRLVGVQRPAPIHRRRVLWPELIDADTLTPRPVAPWLLGEDRSVLGLPDRASTSTRHGCALVSGLPVAGRDTVDTD